MAQNKSSAVMAQRREPHDSKKERARAYYKENAEKIKARVRERWRTDPEAKAKDKASRDRRRDKIRAYDRMRAKRDRVKKKIILDRWIKNNPDRYKELARARAHRRRARVLLAEGTHGADDIARILEGQKSRCWWCQGILKDEYHVDHRIALARGGGNGADNIVIACPDCNRRKGTQSPAEFAGRLV